MTKRAALAADRLRGGPDAPGGAGRHAAGDGLLSHLLELKFL
jgi:hypothetical protein